MGRHDGTRIGFAGALLGIGFAGTLALLIYASEVSRSDEGGSVWGDGWFIASLVVASVLAIVGTYYLAAVWFGWPTGSTAIERAYQPRLADTTVEAHRFVPHDYIVVKVGTVNVGRGNIDGAMLNVIVPAFITEIERCGEDGGIGHPHHMGGTDTTSEALVRYQPNLSSIYWNGNLSFPGRTARIAYFRLRMPGMRHDFPLRLSITAPELDEPFDEQFHVRASALRP